MVILDGDILGTCLGPDEADAPLIIDADAVLARSIPLQSLQPVARRDTERVEVGRRIELMQLPIGHLVDPGIELGSRFAQPDAFGVAVAERSDHTPSMSDITRSVNNARR